jgi:hypothetical protein
VVFAVEFGYGTLVLQLTQHFANTFSPVFNAAPSDADSTKNKQLIDPETGETRNAQSSTRGGKVESPLIGQKIKREGKR